MSAPEGGSAGSATTVPLSTAERDELERLRAEVEALRAAPTPPTPPTPPPPAPRARRRVRWASLGATVLIVLGVLGVPLSILAVWTNNQISDTDRFVATVSPVIEDPAVQAALANRITTEIFARVDVQQIADEAVDALAKQGLPPQLADRLHALTGPLADSTRSFIDGKVRELVASPRFGEAVNRALATSQEQMVKVLSGQAAAISIQGSHVVLDLGVFIDAAKQQLVASGFELAGRIPEINPTVDLFPASTLVRAQTAYGFLDTAATWLPWVTLLLLAGGVLLAKNRRRGLLWVGVGAMIAMVVLAAALLVGRGLLVSSVPEQGSAAAAATYDILVRFLRIALRTVFVVGLVIALGAFLTGGSTAATKVRSVSARGIGWLRRGRFRTLLSTSGVGPWVYAYRTILRTALVLLAVLVVLFLDRPTGMDVLVVTIVLVVLLGVVELLAVPPPDDPAPDDPSTDEPSTDEPSTDEPPTTDGVEEGSPDAGAGARPVARAP